MLRRSALVAAVVGGAGSVALTWYAGRGGPVFLKALFAVWVVSPFALLLWAWSKKWPPAAQTTLHVLALVIAAVSLAVYGGVTLATERPRGPAFVMLPPLSWLAIAAALPIAARVARRRGAM